VHHHHHEKEHAENHCANVTLSNCNETFQVAGNESFQNTSRSLFSKTYKGHRQPDNGNVLNIAHRYLNLAKYYFTEFSLDGVALSCGKSSCPGK
jgi:hypothetical protein